MSGRHLGRPGNRNNCHGKGYDVDYFFQYLDSDFGWCHPLLYLRFTVYARTLQYEKERDDWRFVGHETVREEFLRTDL